MLTHLWREPRMNSSRSLKMCEIHCLCTNACGVSHTVLGTQRTGCAIF